MIQTGTPIDALTGGLAPRTVTLIYGPTGCGKTTLCVRLVNNLLARQYTAVYIDTEGGVSLEAFSNPEDVQLIRADSLHDQDAAIKRLPELPVNTLKTIVVVDTMTGHFHRQVLAAPGKFRGARAADLSGRLVAQLTFLRNFLKGESVAVVTAHLRSSVAEAFRESEARKVAELIRKGLYRPDIRDFEKFVAYDPVKWIGGQGLGMHTQMRFRIWVESRTMRILELEKWPATPPYCVRYDPEFRIVGERFMMDEATRAKLLKEERAAAARRLAEELGVPIEAEEAAEEGTEEAAQKKRKEGRGAPSPGRYEAPSLDELIRRIKEKEE